MRIARAVAHSNIALAKYWGKADTERNLPAVPSLSMTLDALKTETTVCFDEGFLQDEVNLDGALAAGKARSRVITLLDAVRLRAGISTPARVSTSNNFPTAAGLASSASGFAALALAAVHAAGLEFGREDVSAIARQASASAARSLFGGYATLAANGQRAQALASAEHFPLSMAIALTVMGPKDVGSTEAMQLTRSTSPYYSAWVEAAPRLFDDAVNAVKQRDLAALGAAAEQSALLMHASMMGASPPILYFQPATLAVVAAVRELRVRGTLAFFTMDAGPHVKVLTTPGAVEDVANVLRGVPGVLQVITTGIGPDASVQVEAT